MERDIEVGMEKYDSYKDSGVQWLGQIPSHWRAVRLKRICNMKSGDNLTSNDIADEGTYPVYGANGFRGYYHDYNKNGKFLLVGRQGALAGNVHRVDGMFWATDHAVVTSISPQQDMDYMFYALISMTLNQYAFDTAAQPGLAVSKILLLSCPLPPLHEQQAIVSYLDGKCGKIDQLLENKAKELELLAEMKQRVIADAVTKGLNPDATMKESGIPWLPQIPEHWEASKVSTHFRQRNEKVSDKDYPALSVSKQGITPQLENVALSNAEGNSRRLVRIGDYAVNSRSDRKGSCGVSKYEGSVSLITIVLEPRNIYGGYVHFLFRSTPWVEEFYRNGRGIVADLWTTNYQMMKGMYLPIPPIDEQKAIVAYIEDHVAKIDTLAQKLQQEIDSIKEYKQRLILDVVTGQIKVC